MVGGWQLSLLKPYSVCVVPPRHVGKNDRVAFLQSRFNLDQVHGGTSGFHLCPYCAIAFAVEDEHGDGAVLLTERWAPNVQHVFQLLEIDGAVNAQIRTCALRQLSSQLYVNC